MPTTTKVNIYLGTGQEGMRREDLIQQEAKKRHMNIGQFIWYCVEKVIDQEKK